MDTTLKAEYILDLQKQLTLLGSETWKDSSGVLTDYEPIPRVNQVDKVCFPSSLTQSKPSSTLDRKGENTSCRRISIV